MLLHPSSPCRLRLLFISLLPSKPLTPFSSISDPQIPTPPNQECVLYALKRLAAKPDKALDLFNSTAAAASTPAAYSLILRILSPHKHHTKDFWVVLKSMQQHDHALDATTYQTLLSNFKKHSMKQEAAALAQFHTSSAQKSESDAAITSVSKLIMDYESLPEAQLESAIPDLSEITASKILRELCNEPKKAMGFFRWAASRPTGYKHGSVAYNAAARVLGSREDSIGEFWSLVEEMKAEGHEMDIDTYVKLSRRFQKVKMMEEAVKLYELMMDGPYKPDIQDCGVLLRNVAWDLDLVYRVVRKYEAAGYGLSKVVYDGIHRSLTRAGKFKEADEIFRKMKEEGYEPDNITYSQLVYGLCKAQRLEDACRVLDEMEDSGCVPDLKTWTILIQGHCSAGEVDKALECMTKMMDKGNEADADLIEVLVRGLCGERRVEGAYNLFVEMVKARVRPWQATYKYLIQELLRVAKLEEALKVLGLMKSHKFPPFADPFAPHISKYGTVEDAREFLKALTVSKDPTPTAYLHVFKSFFQEGRYSEAQDLLYKCPHHIRNNVDICKLFGDAKVGNAA